MLIVTEKSENQIVRVLKSYSKFTKRLKTQLKRLRRCYCLKSKKAKKRGTCHDCKIPKKHWFKTHDCLGCVVNTPEGREATAKHEK